MPKTGRPAKYQNLTKDFLEQKYLKENWSTVEIAKLIGCDPRLVGIKLKNYGIQLRSLSSSHRKNAYTFNGDRDVLYGSLLGDGSLLRRNIKTDIGLASFSKKNIGYDHVWFVGQAILGSDPTNRIEESHPKGGKTAFRFRTQTCEEFLLEYKRWYPNKKKVVPRDLRLNKKIILHWFMDDGHSSWKNKQKTRIALGFSTESFLKSDCEYLCDEFAKLGCEAYLGKSHGGEGYKVFLRASSHDGFFDLIGPCPVASMSYKWKIKNG